MPDENLVFHREQREEKVGALLDTFMYRIVSLPNGRTFAIGGSKDIHGSQCAKTTYELVDD